MKGIVLSIRTTIAAFETEFYRAKQYMEVAIVSDIGLHEQINPRQNSIAVIMQHLHGNMLSRFTRLLETDGEKPSRNREAEFVDRGLSRDRLMALWEEGWSCVFDATARLTDRDLSRIVTIRNEPHTVALGIARQVAHYSWHAGQMALIGKHLVGERWNYLTIPPGESEAFNARMIATKND
jgi:Protein of unknown function (DUF1572)